MGIITDITERKKAEEALMESEKKARAIVANAPIGIATSGTDKHFISANEAFCKILGYTEDELIKLTFKDITHPGDLKESTMKMCELENGRISSFILEKRYVKKDGNVIDGKVMVSAYVVFFIAELEDIP
jgi:PAS domain S-box-containing protein